MFYILIVQGKVHEVIPEFHPNLPSVPIEERYSAEFLAQTVQSDVEIPQNWIYHPATKTFSEPLVAKVQEEIFTSPEEGI